MIKFNPTVAVNVKETAGLNNITYSKQYYVISLVCFVLKDWSKEDYSGGCPVNVMAPGLLMYYHPSLRKPCGR